MLLQLCCSMNLLAVEPVRNASTNKHWLYVLYWTTDISQLINSTNYNNALSWRNQNSTFPVCASCHMLRTAQSCHTKIPHTVGLNVVQLHVCRLTYITASCLSNCRPIVGLNTTTVTTWAFQRLIYRFVVWERKREIERRWRAIRMFTEGTNITLSWLNDQIINQPTN
jgi:hypothetical protein